MADQDFYQSADPIEDVFSAFNLNTQKKMYLLSVSVLVPTTNDTPFMLLRNPAGSGKRLHLWKIGAFVSNDTNTLANIRFHTNAVLTSTGTPALIVNGYAEAVPVGSAMQAFTNPIASNVGVRFWNILAQSGTNGSFVMMDFSGALSLGPGKDILLVANSDGTNRTIEFSSIWVEV